MVACAGVVKSVKADAKVSIVLCNETCRIDIRLINDYWCELQKRQVTS